MTDTTHNTQELNDFFSKLVEARPHIAERVMKSLIGCNDFKWASKQDLARIDQAAANEAKSILFHPQNATSDFAENETSRGNQ